MDFYRENKKAEISIIIVCILILLPLFLISVYNRPSGDDLDYAIRTHLAVAQGGNLFDVLVGAWDTSAMFYNTWQGLYTSAFLLALQPGIWGAEYYVLSIYIVLGIAYLCTFISVSIINKHLVKKSMLFSATASMAVLTMLVLRLPSAKEGLFWYNGAMNYMPFAFLTLLNMALIYENYHTQKRAKKITMMAISMLLSFVISGGNHVTAFANILLLVVVNLFLLYKKELYAILPLLTAIAGFVIVYIAPGTAIRQEYLSSRSVRETIIETIMHVKDMVGEWMSFTWMLSMLIVTPIIFEVIVKNKEKCPKHFPIIPLLASMMVICGMFCVPYLPMGNFGEGRVENVIWLTFMFLSIYDYGLILGYFYRRGLIQPESFKGDKYSPWKRMILVLICLLGIMLPEINGKMSSSWEARYELQTGIAKRYCAEADQRIALYEDEDLEVVEVTPYQNVSKLLFMFDVSTNPNDWPNTSIGAYYDKIVYAVTE